VEMKNSLPSTGANVHHSTVSVLNVALARDLRRNQVTAANHVGVFSLCVVQSRKMFLRDHQHVRRSLRLDVFKGEDMLVLINLLRGNLATDNAAEKAVAVRIGHRLSPAEITMVKTIAPESGNCQRPVAI
jgi:hypothetical protein